MKMIKKIISVLICAALVMGLCTAGAEGIRHAVPGQASPVRDFVNTWVELVRENGLENNVLRFAVKGCDGQEIGSVSLQAGKDLIHISTDIPELAQNGLPTGLILGRECAGIEMSGMTFALNYSELERLPSVFMEQELGLDQEALNELIQSNISGITSLAMKLLFQGCGSFSSLKSPFDGATTTKFSADLTKTEKIVSESMKSWAAGNDGKAAAEKYARLFKALTGMESTQENWVLFIGQFFDGIAEALSGTVSGKAVTRKNGVTTFEGESTLFGKEVTVSGTMTPNENGVVLTSAMKVDGSDVTLDFSREGNNHTATLKTGDLTVEYNGESVKNGLHFTGEAFRGSESVFTFAGGCQLDGESLSVNIEGADQAQTGFSFAVKKAENDMLCSVAVTESGVKVFAEEYAWDGTAYSMKEEVVSEYAETHISYVISKTAVDAEMTVLSYEDAARNAGTQIHATADVNMDEEGGLIDATVLNEVLERTNGGEWALDERNTLQITPQGMVKTEEDGDGEVETSSWTFSAEDASHLTVTVSEDEKTYVAFRGAIEDRTMTLTAYDDDGECEGVATAELISAEPYTVPASAIQLTAEWISTALSNLLQSIPQLGSLID